MRIRSSLQNHRTARQLIMLFSVFVLVVTLNFPTRLRSVVKAQQDTPHETQVQFTNPAPIAPADRVSNNAGTDPGLPPAPVYPSTINVAGLSGTITKVTVTFEVTSTFPDDLDILLVGPTGAKTLIISDGGGSGNVTNRTYTFDQLAATPFPDDGTDAMPVPAGTYRPANYAGFVTPEPGGQDNFPMAGGLQLFPSPTLDVFNGTIPNGTWKLYVVDDQVIDLNSLPNGWKIDITTSGPTVVPNSRTCDFDGDNKTDLAVTRPSGVNDRTWILRNSSTLAPTFQRWGLTGDVEVPQDYDGDGKTDIAIFRSGLPATWYILRSSDSTLQIINWGQSADDPSVVDDYNGDGRADAAVVRNQGGFKVWYILYNFGALPPEGLPPFVIRQWGLSTDRVAPGDYDGDGRADFGVQRTEGSGPTKATFYFLYSDGGAFARPWGQNSDFVVPGDYDGDGKVDISVVHAEGGNLFWWIVLSNGGLVLGDQFGLSTDTPAQGDYDGDNITDEAVWRLSTGSFYVKLSGGGGVVSIPWGQIGDRPVASYNTH